AARARHEVGKVEAAEIHVGMRTLGRARGARARETIIRVEAYLVVHLPLLGIAQDVVSLLHILEALLGGFVAGVQIWMIFVREFPVSLADFLRVGFAGNAERLVILVLG